MTGRSCFCAEDGSHAVIAFRDANGEFYGTYMVKLEQMSYRDDPEYFRSVFAVGRRFFDVFPPEAVRKSHLTVALKSLNLAL